MITGERITVSSGNEGVMISEDEVKFANIPTEADLQEFPIAFQMRLSERAYPKATFDMLWHGVSK